MKHIFLALLFLAAPLFAGPILSIKNKEGVELSIELLGVDEASVTFKTIENNAEHTVPIESLDPESVVLVRKQAANLPVLFPKLDLDVVIGKRRKTPGYDLATISSMVKITNPSLRRDCPKVKARIVFLGSYYTYKDRFRVLATRDFVVAPKSGKTEEVKLREFDSGYYEGYLLILTDEKGNVVDYKTLWSPLGKAISGNVGILKAYMEVAEGTLLDKSLVPPSLTPGPAVPLPDVVPN